VGTFLGLIALAGGDDLAVGALRWNRDLPDLSVLISNLAAMAVLLDRLLEQRKRSHRLCVQRDRGQYADSTQQLREQHAASNPANALTGAFAGQPTQLEPANAETSGR
jgi:hypothetical protein